VSRVIEANLVYR